MSKYSSWKLQQYLNELNSDRLQLTCGKHNYIAELRKPPTTSGCKECWKAYFITLYAKTPPHLRQESLDQLEAGIHHGIELEEKGKWDVQLDRYPHIKIDKDAEPN